MILYERYGVWRYLCKKHIKKMASQSDGAIVGSASIKIIEKYGKDAPQYVEAYVKEMVDALK